MPALRENPEAEPLLTGNGGAGGDQAGDGNQLGESFKGLENLLST